MRLVFQICIFIAVMSAGHVALAQSEVPDGYTTIRVEFSGTVTSSITDEITVRDSSGNLVPYSGPVPDYPFETGDAITIGFDAVVPTGETIAAGLVPPSADGIYSFQIGPRPDQLDQFPQNASYINLSGSEGITGSGNFSTDGGLSIVYDANNDTYQLNPTGAGVGGDLFGVGFFDAPVLVYDQNADMLSTALFSDLLPLSQSTIAWSGTGDDAGRIPLPILNYANGQFTGFSGNSTGSNLRFTGGWNIPLFGRGEPVQVPEPPIAILFGIAAAGFWARRRRATRAVA